MNTIFDIKNFLNFAKILKRRLWILEEKEQMTILTERS